MNNLTLTLFLVCLAVVAARAHPIEVDDAVVEIERQRLIKFPDELDQRRDSDGTATNNTVDKQDEAKRILEEIEKINHALGYVRKQSDQSRLPPILDSSQYLFPKPPVQPFHQQSHQTAGSNGATILIPSIRALRPADHYAPSAATRAIEYNAPARKRTKQAKHSSRSQLKAIDATRYFYRPNQVLVPVSQSVDEQSQQQLPTHFVIPVRLYRLNKDEYLQKYTPQEYRVNGYKIVGDIDHFYGKSKTKNKAHKHKATPKYHLFFLPREMALNEGAGLKYPTQAKQGADAPNSSREEKLTNRPFKIQSTATTNHNNNSGATSNNATSQVERKRIVPKPLRNKETNVGASAVQQLPGGGASSASTTIRITPPALGVSANANANANLNLNGNGNGNGHGQGGALPGANFNGNGNAYSNGAPTSNSNPNPNNNNNFNVFNLRPAANNNNNIPPNTAADIQNNNNTNAANAIKTAFQNIFKFPFRPEPKPHEPVATMAPPNLETVPLQTPPKTFFTAPQSLLPQPFYTVDTAASHNNDYKWDDEMGGSASHGEDSGDDDSVEQEEKKIFGHHHHGFYQQQQQQQQDTNREAIKQGGIVIQRLKVRKGGIAIAGPGGVATAGSGGTAIVGPGGYALTHPRSLTIAGPGAKVIAIPAGVDLQDALRRTNLATQSFPREGKVVATGPTVYYAPGTGTSIDTGTGADAASAI